MALRKVRVQLLNENTGIVEDEVDVLTSAECVMFADGETFQQKLNAGKLTGPTGPKGNTGDRGATGSQGPAGTNGATGAKGNTGTSIRFKGEWSSTVAYVSDSNYIDLVTNGGNTYRCKSNNTNQAVTNTTYWELIAQKGSQGAVGPAGAVGPKGATGASGPTGAAGPKGDDGDSVVVGASYSSGVKKRLFFKLV